MKRACGDCQLCCRLLPVADGVMVDGRVLPGGLHKIAGQTCQHQRHGKGCAIYDHRPFSCRMWSCGWLANNLPISRPDRSHYVVDPMPDYVILAGTDQGDIKMPIVQIWIDPKYPDAHRDPALRAWLDSINMGALVRYTNEHGINFKCITIWPPSMTGEGWHEEESQYGGPEHSAEDIFEVCGNPIKVEAK